MPDHKPEPWESGAAGPFLWIDGSPVEVWALGEDRFAVRAPGHERLVTGLEEAQQAAHARAAAARLGSRKARGPMPSFIGPLERCPEGLNYSGGVYPGRHDAN